MYVNVSEKVVVITGSSRGLGRRMAIKFAREGAKVVINYLKNYKKAYELCKYIKNFNQNCLVVQADVTKEEGVKKLYKYTMKTFGKVDILINNVGVCSKVFSKEMIRSECGKIINIASLKGQLGSEGQSNYSASKAGVIAFTKSLAKELAVI